MRHIRFASRFHEATWRISMVNTSRNSSGGSAGWNLFLEASRTSKKLPSRRAFCRLATCATMSDFEGSQGSLRRRWYNAVAAQTGAVRLPVWELRIPRLANIAVRATGGRVPRIMPPFRAGNSPNFFTSCACVQ